MDSSTNLHTFASDMKNGSNLLSALENLGLKPDDIGLTAEMLLTKGKLNPFEEGGEKAKKPTATPTNTNTLLKAEEVLEPFLIPIIESYFKPLKEEVILLKGMVDELGRKDKELKKAHSSLNEEKSFEFDLIKARLEKLEQIPMFGRKSFERSNYLQKGIDPELEKDSKTLSTNNRAGIVKILTEKFDNSLEKGEKGGIWGKAILAFESTGTLTEEAKTALKKEGFEFEN